MKLKKFDELNEKKFITNGDLKKEKVDDGKPYTRSQIEKIPYLYHATPMDNLFKMNDGIKAGPDGLVYFSDSYVHAVSFLMFRNERKLVVFKVDTSKLDKDKIEESFDHSFDFFHCRAFTYDGDVPNDAFKIEDCMTYDLNNL
jgi:hypothetical protein